MSPAMIHASSIFLATLADAAARSILLGCFAAALLAVFRVKSVRMKLLSWRGALIAALSMPLLVALCPAIPLPVLVPSLARHVAAVQAEAPQSDGGVSEPRVAPTVPDPAGHRGPCADDVQSSLRAGRSACRSRWASSRFRGSFSPSQRIWQSFWLFSLGWPSAFVMESGYRTRPCRSETREQ